MDKSNTIFALLFFALISFNVSAQMALASSFPNEESNRESIVGDITAPRTDLLRTEAGAFIFGPATRIKFKIIEEESGVETTYFKVAGFPFMKSDGRQMMPHDLADGEYKILYYSIDKEGNQEQVRTDIIYLDKTGPVVSSSFSKSPSGFNEGIPVFEKDVHLIIQVDDKLVEVQKVTYSINGGPKIESKELHTIDLAEELAKIEDESIKVEVTAYDIFYNISKEVIEFKIER